MLKNWHFDVRAKARSNYSSMTRQMPGWLKRTVFVLFFGPIIPGGAWCSAHTHGAAEPVIRVRMKSPRSLARPNEARSFGSIRSDSVVVRVSMERYLESVIQGEFNPKWSKEAVDAQVIAARTYAYHQLLNARKKLKDFDVESTEADQVYLGDLGNSHEMAPIIARTRGVVLVAKKTKNPIKAFFHASCGGGVTPPKQVWGQVTPGIRTKSSVCPYCVNAPVQYWEARLSAFEIHKKISRLLPEVYRAEGDYGLVSMRGSEEQKVSRQTFLAGKWIPEAVADETDGHARERNARVHIDLIHQASPEDRNHPRRQVQIELSADHVRQALDPRVVRSTWFKVRPQGRELVISGKGFGHGVGMCQWGAKRMGELGKTAPEVLKFYYPEAELARFW